MASNVRYQISSAPDLPDMSQPRQCAPSVWYIPIGDFHPPPYTSFFTLSHPLNFCTVTNPFPIVVFMIVSSVRTRLVRRTVDVGSLKMDDVLKFIRSGGHSTEQGQEYLLLILNHFTISKYVTLAHRMVQLATYSI